MKESVGGCTRGVLKTITSLDIPIHGLKTKHKATTQPADRQMGISSTPKSFQVTLGKSRCRSPAQLQLHYGRVILPYLTGLLYWMPTYVKALCTSKALHTFPLLAFDTPAYDNNEKTVFVYINSEILENAIILITKTNMAQIHTYLY